MRGRNKIPENATVTRAQRRPTLLDHQKQNEVDQPMQLPAANAQPRQHRKQQQRELIIRADGPGHGPVPAWFLEIAFLAWNNGTYSVYLRRGNGDNPPTRPHQTATLPGPLTWRRALRHLRENRNRLAIGRSHRHSVSVLGVPSWQEDFFAGTLASIGDTKELRRLRLLTTLPDHTLASLDESDHYNIAHAIDRLVLQLHRHRATIPPPWSLPRLAAAFNIDDPTNVHRILHTIKDQRPASTNKTIYWRVAPDDNLVFTLPHIAGFISQIHQAIQTSQTWGEFQSRMPAETSPLGACSGKEFADLWTASRELPGDALLTPQTKFSSAHLPAYCDGDYPPWLQKNLEDYLPGPILRNLGGAYQASIANGGYWAIPQTSRSKLIAQLMRHGYRPVRRQDLTFW